MTPRTWCPLFFLVLLSSWLPAESLRGNFRGEVLPEGPAVTMGLDELVQISLPTATRFTRALEIEVTIPRDVFPFRSNLAVFVYQHYVPGKTAAGGSGERIATEVLPPAAKFYLKAPLVAKAGLKAAVDTAILKVPEFEDGFPLAVTILPIDKELPPGYEKFQFSVRSRWVNSNLGALVLVTPSLSEEDRQRLKVTANGVPQPSEGPLLLEPGPYTLEVALPGVDTVTLTAVVAQAKTTEVPVDLVMEEPSLVIEAPEGTLVVLDGKKLSWKPLSSFPVDRGTHEVQFVIGNTVVTDTITIEKGGRHRLALKMTIGLVRE